MRKINPTLHQLRTVMRDATRAFHRVGVRTTNIKYWIVKEPIA